MQLGRGSTCFCSHSPTPTSYPWQAVRAMIEADAYPGTEDVFFFDCFVVARWWPEVVDEFIWQNGNKMWQERKKRCRTQYHLGLLALHQSGIPYPALSDSCGQWWLGIRGVMFGERKLMILKEIVVNKCFFLAKVFLAETFALLLGALRLLAFVPLQSRSGHTWKQPLPAGEEDQGRPVQNLGQGSGPGR